MAAGAGRWPDHQRGRENSVKLATILISALTLAAASSAASAQTIIAVDGSSTVFPITEAMAEEFQKANPGIKVTVGIAGTGGGFKKFCRGETDISDASRRSRSPRPRTARRTASSIELPVALDALAVWSIRRTLGSTRSPSQR
jgi:phosphate transport system substrate-binding protein